MENNNVKSFLVSENQLNDIIDKYEYLMFILNTQITPTINLMIQLQKEVQSIDALLPKTKEIKEILNQVNLKIGNLTNEIFNEKVEKAIRKEIELKSEILDEIIKKQNQKIYKKELFVISFSCLLLGVLIGCFI